jgi:protein phosphatase 2C-like protein
MAMSFELAGGSVMGRDHIRTGKNCQDAYSWKRSGGVYVAAVCDGCGSSDNSEVGAQIGVKLVVEATLRHYLADPSTFLYGAMKNPGLQAVKRSVLTKVQALAEGMAGSFSENVSQYFLFTILGVIVDPKEGKAVIFGCGDGVFYVNDHLTAMHSPNNAPAYLSYNLVETNQSPPDLGVLWMGPIEEVKSILIGTDGVEDLARSFDKPIPGKEEKIGPISQFWEKDGPFRNPFLIGHRLTLINRSISRVDWEKKAMSEAHGPLRDDTTFVVIRRKKV